jgi:hypothetical protein
MIMLLPALFGPNRRVIGRNSIPCRRPMPLKFSSSKAVRRITAFP